MRIAEVSSLLPRSNQTSPWHIEPHDPQADCAALEQLAAACEEFSPTIALDHGVARPESAKKVIDADSLYLDVTGLAPLFGGESALARRIVTRFDQRRLIARVALADTFSAAWAMTHYGFGVGQKLVSAEKCQLLADKNVCPTTFLVPPGQTRAAVEPLPLAALRLDDETLDLLAQLGLACVGDLLRIPRESLPSRFGPALIRRLDETLGDVGEAIIPFRSPPEFSVGWSLEYPTTRRDMLEHVLAHLVRHLARALTDRNQGALALSVRLSCLAGRSVELDVGLFEPSDRPEHLLDLVRLRLERLALPEAVEKIVVAAPRTAAIVPRQFELFTESKRYPAAPGRELARLVDRLASRLGGQSVGRSRLSASAQPELAYRHEPIVGHASRAAARAVSPKKVDKRIRLPHLNRPRRHAQRALPPEFGPLHRPLFLRSSPTAVEVIAVVPDGPPKVLRDQGEVHSIARHWGPERIETSWWRGRLVRRDYYRVETRAGRRFWLFRRLSDGRWFLHGEFE
jgi:protein ImuB